MADAGGKDVGFLIVIGVDQIGLAFLEVETAIAPVGGDREDAAYEFVEVIVIIVVIFFAPGRGVGFVPCLRR